MRKVAYSQTGKWVTMGCDPERCQAYCNDILYTEEEAIEAIYQAADDAVASRSTTNYARGYLPHKERTR